MDRSERKKALREQGSDPGSVREVAGIIDFHADVGRQEVPRLRHHLAVGAMGAIDGAIRRAARARYPSEAG